MRVVLKWRWRCCCGRGRGKEGRRKGKEEEGNGFFPDFCFDLQCLFLAIGPFGRRSPRLGPNSVSRGRLFRVHLSRLAAEFEVELHDSLLSTFGSETSIFFPIRFRLFACSATRAVMWDDWMRERAKKSNDSLVPGGRVFFYQWLEKKIKKKKRARQEKRAKKEKRSKKHFLPFSRKRFLQRILHKWLMFHLRSHQMADAIHQRASKGVSPWG